MGLTNPIGSELSVLLSAHQDQKQNLEIIMDLLTSLADTPVPNVLVIAGIVFLLLAVAGKVGANLSIPAQRQTMAAAIGTVLLLSGIAMFAIPPPGSQGTGQQGGVDGGLVDEPDITDSATVKANIITAIEFAAFQDIKARYWLDPAMLESVYQGEYLRISLASLDSSKRDRQFEECKIVSREFHYFDINENTGRAKIDMTEQWNCATYSVENGDCVAQYESASPLRQTVFMERSTSGWMLSNVKFDGSENEGEWVACTNEWPANIQR